MEPTFSNAIQADSASSSVVNVPDGSAGSDVNKVPGDRNSAGNENAGSGANDCLLFGSPHNGLSGASSRRRSRRHFRVTCALAAIIIILLATNLVVHVHHRRCQSHPNTVVKPEATTVSAPADSTGPISTADAPVPPTTAKSSQPVEFIQVAIDILAVQECRKGLDRMQPCRNNTTYITSESEVLNPLRCVDDAYLENRTANADSCAAGSSTFQLMPSSGRVRVLRPGAYMIIARMTVRMPEAAQVHLGVAINGDHLSFLCTVQSYGSLGPNQPAPYSDCSVQGLRRLKLGDEVWLFVPQGGVPLQTLYRSTFAQIARIGD